MATERIPSKAGLRAPFTRRKQLEKDLEHITQEMYRRNKELAETNRTLSLLRAIDNLVLDAHYSLPELSQKIVAAVTELSDYQLAAILIPNGRGTGDLEVAGWSLKKEALPVADLSVPTGLRLRAAPRWLRSHGRSKLIHVKAYTPEKLSRMFGVAETQAAEIHQKVPLSSVYVVKLTIRQKLVGILAIGFLHHVKAEEDINSALLDRLGEAVGVALDNKILFEENQRVAAQLRKTNAKLKALDEAKDEFISMASHQLRTPLTTIKGYLSMILDGDVGEVKKNQQEMIKQAFDSAQRMVYLIADLLNVSRMQTGKFVIENRPTDLATVVEGEIAQLKEQAANREIELIYNKPAQFPTLNLDETKIRQVIMNFLDNALYYTPKGGKIESALSATDESVSYTVTDTGVGVPKTVQHHLFSKFYRADNARKMRPDGTGLGLYMAKKVVVAQGGAIIFKSTGGQGSTFGFSFPKKGMETKDKPPVESSDAKSTSTPQQEIAAPKN